MFTWVFGYSWYCWLYLTLNLHEICSCCLYIALLYNTKISLYILYPYISPNICYVTNLSITKNLFIIFNHFIYNHIPLTLQLNITTTSINTQIMKPATLYTLFCIHPTPICTSSTPLIHCFPAPLMYCFSANLLFWSLAMLSTCYLQTFPNCLPATHYQNDPQSVDIFYLTFSNPRPTWGEIQCTKQEQ